MRRNRYGRNCITQEQDRTQTWRTKGLDYHAAMGILVLVEVRHTYFQHLTENHTRIKNDQDQHDDTKVRSRCATRRKRHASPGKGLHSGQSRKQVEDWWKKTKASDATGDDARAGTPLDYVGSGPTALTRFCMHKSSSRCISYHFIADALT